MDMHNNEPGLQLYGRAFNTVGRAQEIIPQGKRFCVVKKSRGGAKEGMTSKAIWMMKAHFAHARQPGVCDNKGVWYPQHFC